MSSAMFQMNFSFKGIQVKSTCLHSYPINVACSGQTAYLSDEGWSSCPQHLKKQFKADSEQFSQGLFTLVIYFKTATLKPDHFKR